MICTIDNCEKEAAHTFVWPWGADGACCQGHVVVVQQKARAARGKFGSVSFTRLDPDRVVAITRDERVELHSARLVAESERDDAALRASNLFTVNTKQADELRALRARVAQFEAQAKESEERIYRLIGERDAALIELSKLREQVETLGVVLDRDTPREGFPSVVG